MKGIISRLDQKSAESVYQAIINEEKNIEETIIEKNEKEFNIEGFLNELKGSITIKIFNISENNRVADPVDKPYVKKEDVEQIYKNCMKPTYQVFNYNTILFGGWLYKLKEYYITYDKKTFQKHLLDIYQKLV